VRFGSRFGGKPFRTAPVKEGDVLNVEIEAIGGKGDGIAKKEGFVLFVPNTKKGDQVQVKITRVLRNMAFAEVVGEGQEQGQEQEQQNIEDTENFGEEE